MVIKNRLVPFKGFKAMNVCGIIFVREEFVMYENDFNHESIHTEQWKELLYIGFIVLYVLDFIFNYVKFRNWHEAYREIFFEKEAYSHEYDFEYLKNRKKFSWIDYL